MFTNTVLLVRHICRLPFRVQRLPEHKLFIMQHEAPPAVQSASMLQPDLGEETTVGSKRGEDHNIMAMSYMDIVIA